MDGVCSAAAVDDEALGGSVGSAHSNHVCSSGSEGSILQATTRHCSTHALPSLTLPHSNSATPFPQWSLTARSSARFLAALSSNRGLHSHAGPPALEGRSSLCRNGAHSNSSAAALRQIEIASPVVTQTPKLSQHALGRRHVRAGGQSHPPIPSHAGPSKQIPSLKGPPWNTHARGSTSGPTSRTELRSVCMAYSRPATCQKQRNPQRPQHGRTDSLNGIHLRTGQNSAQNRTNSLSLDGAEGAAFNSKRN